MYLLSLATSSPAHRYTQRDCHDVFIRSRARHRLTSRSVALMKKVLLRDNGIDERGFCYPELDTIFDAGPGKLNKVFEDKAPELGAAALAAALEKAGIAADDLDGLIVCTCTGYLCPGLSSFIAERLNLRPDAELSDLVGMGCAAAIPSLRQAWFRLKARPESRIAVLAVEVCSAAFYLDDDPGVIISACLFGDGAAASVWTGLHPDHPAWQAGEFQSLHLPRHRDLLRFENVGGALRNRLAKNLPQEAASAVKTLLDEAHASGMDPDHSKILPHTGGRDILDALESAIGGSFPESRTVLRQHGNMSSPSVLFVLDQYLRQSPNRRASAWLTSFGAGFSAHGFQLKQTTL